VSRFRLIVAIPIVLAIVSGACADAGTDVTTTTEPPLPYVGVAGPIDVTAALILEADGLGAIPFGHDPDATVTAVASVLGLAPELDSGWIDSFASYGTCPGTEIRAVEFGDLIVLFTDAATQFGEAGSRHFFSYTYRVGSRGPDDLETARGIGLGSALGALTAAYPDTLTLFPEDLTAGGPRYEIIPTSRIGRITGFVGGTAETDPVLAVDGGIGCGDRPVAS
jgi:hypothetical protein